MPAKKPANKTSWRNRIVGEGEVDPKSLTANPSNWRIHPAEQTKALDGILSEVGWVQRVIVNRNTNRICDGHARVAAAIARGEKTVPVVFVELSPEDEKRVLATLDSSSAMAGMDDQKLRQLIADIDFQAEGARELLANLGQLADEQANQNPQNLSFPEYDEKAADDVAKVVCPKCGHEFPK